MDSSVTLPLGLCPHLSFFIRSWTSLFLPVNRIKTSYVLPDKDHIYDSFIKILIYHKNESLCTFEFIDILIALEMQ